MTYQSLNPASGELLASFPDLTDGELETKLAAADACYRTWRRTSFTERAAILLRASVLLHEQAEAFAHQPLQSRLVEKIEGEFFVGEHRQGGAFGSGGQF